MSSLGRLVQVCSSFLENGSGQQSCLQVNKQLSQCSPVSDPADLVKTSSLTPFLVLLTGRIFLSADLALTASPTPLVEMAFLPFLTLFFCSQFLHISYTFSFCGKLKCKLVTKLMNLNFSSPAITISNVSLQVSDGWE